MRTGGTLRSVTAANRSHFPNASALGLLLRVIHWRGRRVLPRLDWRDKMPAHRVPVVPLLFLETNSALDCGDEGPNAHVSLLLLPAITESLPNVVVRPTGRPFMWKRDRDDRCDSGSRHP